MAPFGMNLYNLTSFDTIWTRRMKVFRVVFAALFIATLLLSFSVDVAHAEVNECWLDSRDHGISDEGRDLRTTNVKYIKIGKGYLLHCLFDYSNDSDIIWPTKAKLVKDFKCTVNSSETYASRAIIGVGGRISMTCFFPVNGG
jgi:hypothetical protein